MFDICCHNTNCSLFNRRFKVTYFLVETNINILFSYINAWILFTCWRFTCFKKCGSIISVKPIHCMIMWSIKWFLSTNHKVYCCSEKKTDVSNKNECKASMNFITKLCMWFYLQAKKKSSTLLLRHSQVGNKLSSLCTWSHDHLCN